MTPMVAAKKLIKFDTKTFLSTIPSTISVVRVGFWVAVRDYTPLAARDGFSVSPQFRSVEMAKLE
jgi:hypothetical protein